jgi:hypothetical protein
MEVLKVFGPNVTEASMQKRHDGITLDQWVRMINTTRKDFSSMSLLALEHLMHLMETNSDMYKPLLMREGELCTAHPHLPPHCLAACSCEEVHSALHIHIYHPLPRSHLPLLHLCPHFPRRPSPDSHIPIMFASPPPPFTSTSFAH